MWHASSPGPASTIQASVGSHKTSSGTYSALKTDLPQVFSSGSNPNSMKQLLLRKLLSSEQETAASSITQPQLSATKPTKERDDSDYQIPEIFQQDQSQKLITQKKSTPGLSTYDTHPAKSTSQSYATQAKPNSTPQKREKLVPKIWKVLLHSPPLKSNDLGSRLEDWLFSPSLTDELEKCLSNRQLCMFSVEGT